MKRIALTEIALILASPTYAAPSFDCSKARYADELAICASDDLGRRDRIADFVFEAARALPELHDQVISLTRVSLNARRACGSDVACIRGTQNALISVLTKLSRPGSVATQTNVITAPNPSVGDEPAVQAPPDPSAPEDQPKLSDDPSPPSAEIEISQSEPPTSAPKAPPQVADSDNADVEPVRPSQLKTGPVPAPQRKWSPYQINEARKQMAREVVQERLKDPDSAKFGDTMFAGQADDGVLEICGEVNAKSSFGGYTGMSPFFISTEIGVLLDDGLARRDCDHLAQMIAGHDVPWPD
jgi:uncharacterized protein